MIWRDRKTVTKGGIFLKFEGFMTFKDCCEKVDIPSSTAREYRYELHKKFGIPVVHYNKDNEDDLEETDLFEVVAKQRQELGEYIASIAVREITAVFKNELAARDAVINGLKNELAETRQDVREEIMVTRQEVMTTRQGVGQDIAEMRQSVIAELKQTREDSKTRDLEVVTLAREALEKQKTEKRRGLFWFLK